MENILNIVLDFNVSATADYARVVLTAIDDNEVTTYINAVHIAVSIWQ